VKNFADRLCDSVRLTQNPVVVGLDPRVGNLPNGLVGSVNAPTAEQAAEGFKVFCHGIIDVVAPLVPAVKPQAAFFEQLGPAGMNVLADTITYARDKGLLVVLDAKRNDIGSTAEAYAKAYLGAPPASVWGADALTVSPYLGDDSLQPFVDQSTRAEAGIFVLVKTSNPGGRTFQDLVSDGRPVYEYVAEHVEELALTSPGECNYGVVGAVVGATYPEQLTKLRETIRHGWFLVPGFGAQGGSAKDVAAAFDENGLGAIINNSRGIIFAHQRPEYKDKFGDNRWQEAVEAATRDMIDELYAETPASALKV